VRHKLPTLGADSCARLRGHARVQQAIDALTHRDGFPGALIEVRDASGHSWVSVSGVAELGGRQPVPRDGQFRIGSTTKTFVATVVLQLVASHRVQLDAPIERYVS
jgi:D-alanyl-D-alanine carboxypeptidase